MSPTSLFPFASPRPTRVARFLVCALTGLLCFISTSLAQFQVAPGYPTNGIQQLVVADFNHDGNLDVAGATAGGGTVSVLLGNGDGTLQPYTGYSNGNDPIGISLGDFNGDGNADLAASNNDDFGTASIFLGNGDGTFQAPIDTKTGGGVGLIWDYNGDNKQDLILSIGTHLAIFVGNGNGTFQAPINIEVGVGLSSLVAADFNLDGRWDLAGIGGSKGISVLLGNGDGTFQPHKDSQGEGWSLLVADVNGDGLPDIAEADCCANTLAISLGNGDGTFRPTTLYPDALINNATSEIAVGDFDKDGKLDVATPGVAVFRGNGDGTFQTPFFDYIGDYGYDVAAADLNNDGNLDLISASSTVVVLLGNGDGTFQGSPDYGPSLGADSVVDADFNNDGNPDLAVADGGSDTLSVFLGTSTGALQRPSHFVTGTSPSSVAVADFNLDGKPDLAGTNPLDNNVSLLLGNGDGTFQNFHPYPTSTHPVFAAAADFNQDGKPDLAIANSGDATISILLGNGDGTLQPGTDVSETDPAAVAVDDVNGDGKLDLVVSNAGTNTVSVRFGNGDGTFQASAAYPTGLHPTFAAVGDLDGDGTKDLAVAFGGNPSFNHFVPGGISIFINRGNGTFQPHVDYSGGTPVAVTIKDFDGDGKPDLGVASGGAVCSVFGCSHDYRVALLLGNGDGTFQSPIFYYSGRGGVSLVAPDLNRDGRPDLAVANSIENTVAVFLNNSTGFPEFSLSVSKAGGGSGTVTSSPPGINCGSQCSGGFLSGVTVTLSASADFGSSFAGWSGAGCTGTGACSVSMNSDHAVTATFNLVPDFLLELSEVSPNPVIAGGSATSTINLNAVNGFTDAVSLTCSVESSVHLAPRCSIQPNSITPGSSATLTITTTARTMALVSSSGRHVLFYAMWLPVVGFTLAGFRSRRGKKVSPVGFLWCALLFAGLAFQAACGGGSTQGGGSAGTPNGQYTVTVTGTSGSLRHSSTVTVVVQ